MSDVVIRVENLSKEYRLGTIGHGTLYRDLQSGWARFRGKEDPNARIGSVNREQLNTTGERFWALKDVSFDVRQGEVVGIIGRNGAGKSTLLKIISRVTAPTQGTIKIKGRVASLLEVGTGFHPELTGRENIFLNGAILGMHKGEIEQKFDEIVGFAEIDKFIDTPVKRYSSGMYVRLAFAVAAHLDPEILVVDEVLAVGDAAFQKKCLGKMGDISKEGRTVLFVSHNMGAISTLCKSAILLSEGKVSFKGFTSSVIDRYLSRTIEKNKDVIMFDDDVRKEICLLSVQVFAANSNNKKVIEFSDDIEVIIKYKVRSDLKGTNIYVGFDHKGTTIFQFFDIDYEKNLFLLRKHGLYTLKILIPKNFLNIGQWTISVDAGRPNSGTIIDKQHHCLSFLIENYAQDLTHSGISRGCSIIAPISIQTICE
jgi:lipopolysaccharide transport system ATP-binding protein